MPAYDYDCKDCNISFTIYVSIQEHDSGAKIKCPHCGSDNVIKKISGFFAKTTRKS